MNAHNLMKHVKEILRLKISHNILGFGINMGFPPKEVVFI